MGSKRKRFVSSAIRAVIDERRAVKLTREGSVSAEDALVHGQLAAAGVGYARQYLDLGGVFERSPHVYHAAAEPPDWPRGMLFSPHSPRADLVRAAALLVAEIDRLDRAARAAANAQRQRAA